MKSLIHGTDFVRLVDAAVETFQSSTMTILNENQPILLLLYDNVLHPYKGCTIASPMLTAGPIVAEQ